MTGRGQLTVVGTGITAGRQLTAEARACIAAADRVGYVVADPVTEALIRRLHPAAESLARWYVEGGGRQAAYDRMVDQIMAGVRAGGSVCAVFYGHPGFLVHPAGAAVRLARAEGYSARVLPGVSSLDCLLADLRLDTRGGLQVYRATDFLVRGRPGDPSATLVLLQVDSIADDRCQTGGNDARHLPVLLAYLGRFYGPDRRVVGYAAPAAPAGRPLIHPVQLAELTRQPVLPAGVETLCLPADGAQPADDPGVRHRLGLSPAP